MQCLRVRHVDLQILAQQLLFNAGVVVFAEIDHDVDLQTRKSAFESGFDAKALRDLVTACIRR